MKVEVGNKEMKRNRQWPRDLYIVSAHAAQKLSVTSGAKHDYQTSMDMAIPSLIVPHSVLSFTSHNISNRTCPCNTKDA